MPQELKFTGEYTDKGLKAGLSGATKSLKDMEKAMASVAAVSKQKYEAQQKAAAEAAAKHKESIDRLKKSFQQFAITAGVTGAALKKAFDFMQQGAQVNVLRQSFNQLGGDLEKLREASNNTISDFDLMNATNTLLIGTSGKLRGEFLKNADQLMGIAKAANTLNPALGDTTFLYESIARGIKRSSPLILDNLGLTIKIGEANERYAAQLGKTAEALTAEEQQQALLNEVLRSGADLVEEAKNINVEAADSYAQLTAAYKNFMNTAAEEAGKSGVGGFFTELLQDAEVGLKNLSTIGSKLFTWSWNLDDLTEWANRFRKEIDLMTSIMKKAPPEMDELADAGERTAVMFGNVRYSGQGVNDILEEVKDVTIGLIEPTQALGDELLTGVNPAFRENAEAAALAALKQQEYANSFDDVNRGLARVIEQWKYNLAFFEEGGLAFQEAVLKWQEATENAALAGEDYTHEMAMLNKEMFSYVALTAKVEQMDLKEIQRQFEGLGLETSKAATAAALLYNKFNGIEGLTVKSITQQLVDMGVPIATARDQAEEILQALTGLDGLSIESFIEIFKTTYERTVHGWKSTTTTPSGRKPATVNKPSNAGSRQAGGNFVVPPSWTGDSFPVRATAGERVQVGTKSSTMDAELRRRAEERRRDENLARMIAEAVLVGTRR